VFKGLRLLLAIKCDQAGGTISFNICSLLAETNLAESLVLLNNNEHEKEENLEQLKKFSLRLK